jgi:hypothetical protein
LGANALDNDKSLNELNLFGTAVGTPLLTLWNHGHGEKRFYDTIKSGVVVMNISFCEDHEVLA